MGPRNVIKDDLVCVLFGCNIPLVLRRIQDQETFELIGECFVDGYVNGEVLEEMERGRWTLRKFRLR
jgi:hypothetical protein